MPKKNARPLIDETAYAHLDPLTQTISVNLDRFLSHRWFEEFGLMMWMTFQFPLMNDHRAYVEKRKNHKDVELIINAFTLYAHESRHFHDLLATPYGAFLMRAQTAAGLRMVELREYLQLTHNAIVVPFADWLSSGRFLRNIYPDLEEPTPRVGQTLQEIEQLRNALQVWNDGRVSAGSNGEFPSATSILEGSAILHQEREIIHNFGEPVGRFFRLIMTESPAAATYYGALRSLSASTKGQVSDAAASYILLASLCGDFHGEGLQAPADVLAEWSLWVHKQAVDPLRFSTLEGAAEAMDDFFADCHQTTITDRLEAAAAANTDALNKFEEQVKWLEERTQFASEGARALLETFRNYAEVQRWFAPSVFTDPAWYCTSSYSISHRGVPSCAIVFKTDWGMPISDVLEDYEIFSSSLVRIPPGADPALFVENSAAPGTTEVAHSFSPRSHYVDRESPPVGNPPEPEPLDIDLAVWHQSYAELSGMKLYLEEPKGRTSDAEFQLELNALQRFGTRVFSANGELVPQSVHQPEVPEDLAEWYATIKESKRALPVNDSEGDFAPDYGSWLQTQGFSPATTQFFPHVAINHISVVGPWAYSTMVSITRGAQQYAASFDFGKEMLGQMLSLLSEDARERVIRLLGADPYSTRSIELGESVAMGFEASLGTPETGLNNEAFVPLVITRVFQAATDLEAGT